MISSKDTRKRTAASNFIERMVIGRKKKEGIIEIMVKYWNEVIMLNREDG